MSNHLANENSPYLLQHADNPVNWYPWEQEALEKSKKEDKPIFLSIGYAACHWCHVMAHESFEDPDIAAVMNEHFINIKVDREERPDLDNIYMTATQAMTGSGGWPMSVFLTPDLQPFYAGTYFPPERRYNMPSFREILEAIIDAWKNDRDKAVGSAKHITTHIKAQASPGKFDMSFKKEHLQAAVNSLNEAYDWGYGGWGGAPKFPQAMSIEFLLQQNAAGNSDALKPALHALRAMSRGGMYDVVGGGFSRYSTDNFWRVPHFEKMLYDNAQLVRVYLHAWLTTKEPFFRRVVDETISFIEREMTHPNGGFFSSLDADSEGVEGKYYIWTADQIQEILGDDYEFFKTAYGITKKGNWDGATVLQRALDNSTLAARFNLTPEIAVTKIADCHTRLLAVRNSRPRPGTDDKILTSWNGLMLEALAEAARYLDDQTKSSQQKIYYRMATRNADFLLNTLRQDGKLHRSWRNGNVTGEVFLEDYAALILGLLELYQTDFKDRWFSSALELADEMIECFSDSEGVFFDTPSDGEPLVFRPRDLQDNAIPSGNSLACEALFKLAAFTDNSNYRNLADTSLNQVTEASLRYPSMFGRWLSAAGFGLGNGKQVAVLGDVEEKDVEALIKVLRAEFRPEMVVAASPYPPSKDAPTLLEDRTLLKGKPAVYVCEGFVCKYPVSKPDELEKLL